MHGPSETVYYGTLGRVENTGQATASAKDKRLAVTANVAAMAAGGGTAGVALQDAGRASGAGGRGEQGGRTEQQRQREQLIFCKYVNIPLKEGYSIKINYFPLSTTLPPSLCCCRTVNELV